MTDARSHVDELLGERLRSVRKRRRMTLGEVETISAGEFRVSVLGAYERGERGVQVRRLLRLAEIYEVAPAELLPPKPPELPSGGLPSGEVPSGESPSGESASADAWASYPPDAVL